MSEFRRVKRPSRLWASSGALKTFSPMSEFRRVKDLLADKRVQASSKTFSPTCELRQDKILLFSNEFRYGAEGGRSWKAAKVGSKRTPSQPVFCSEVQGGKERSQRAFLPQIKKRLPKHEARKSWCYQEFLVIGKNSNSGEKVKIPVWWSRSSGTVFWANNRVTVRCLKGILTIRLVALRVQVV